MRRHTDRRLLYILVFVTALYFISQNLEHTSLASLKHALPIGSTDSYSQLFTYFPHDIDCGRIIDGDMNYTQSISKYRQTLDDHGLSMTCSRIKDRFSSAPSFHEAYSIAYVKTVFQDYQFLEQQMWNTYTRNNWYCFSIDHKAPEWFHRYMRQLARCLPNVLISNVSRDVFSDGFNQNYAHLDCMRSLESRNYEYVFLLQNHDILARTHRELASLLPSLEGSAIVDREPCPKDRCVDSYPTNLGKLGLCPKKFQGDQLAACHASNITYMKGSMQALLPKEAADYIVREIDVTKFVDMFCEYFACDEQLFPSLLSTEALKIPGRYTAACGYPSMLRHVVWFDKMDRCASGNKRHGVCIFGLEDLPALKNVQPLIINKMLPSFDNGAIQCYSELLLNRSLGIVSDGINNLASSDYARFQRELREPDFDPARFTCNVEHKNRRRSLSRTV